MTCAGCGLTESVKLVPNAPGGIPMCDDCEQQYDEQENEG